MKTSRWIAAALVAAAGMAQAQPSISVSVAGEVAPGVYGRVDVANGPRPQLVYAQPVTIVRPAPRVVVEPIYLHVPPGHAKNWSKHCKHYNACGAPVYFVKSKEYDHGHKHKDKHKHKDNGGHHH